MDLALAGIRAAAGHELPVLAHVAVGEDLTMADGTPLAAMGERMRALHCDAIGVNCVAEPEIVAAIEALRPLGVPLSAMPSAGLPQRVGDRPVYPAAPERFGVLARRLFDLGARLVGGCCGTAPEHVACIAAAAASLCPEPPALALG